MEALHSLERSLEDSERYCSVYVTVDVDGIDPVFAPEYDLTTNTGQLAAQLPF